MLQVKLDDIVDAFDFVSFGDAYTHEAYFCRKTGKFFLHSEFDDDLEPLPDDIDDADAYVCIPHPHELDLGQRLAIRFVRYYLPEEEENVARMFSWRGGYGRFKQLLQQRRMIDQWYSFEKEAQLEALKHWCVDNEIELGN
jgi:hypothetical protein